MAKELKIKITGDASGLQAATDEGIGILSGFSTRVSAFSVAAGTLLADGLKAGFRAVKGFVGDSIDAASDMKETVSKVGVLFGEAAPQVEKFAASAARSLGQSRQQAMDAAATFATFGKSAGLTGSDLAKFSTDLTGLASDMASFENTSPIQAIQAIGSALRGESEPIRAYGVLLDDASMRQQALEMGIISSIKKALTPQQKVLAAQALIFKQTSAAQGDFARTSDGLANKQRILAAQMSNVKTTVGQAFLPVVLQLVTALSTRLLPVLEEWGPLLAGGVAKAIDTVATAFRESGGPTEGFYGALMWVGVWARDAWEAFKNFLPTLERAADVIGTVLSAAAGFLTDHFDQIKTILKEVGPPLAAAAAAFVAFNQISTAITAVQGFAAAIKLAGSALLANPITLVVAAAAAAFVVAYRHSETFRTAVNALAQRLVGFVKSVRAAFDRGGFGEAFRVALAGIKSALFDLGDWLSAVAWPWLKQKTTELAKALGTWINDTAVPYLRANLPIWLAALDAWVRGTALPWLADKALAFAELLGGWVMDAAGYLRQHLPGWLAALGEWLANTALPWLGGQVSALAQKLGGWISEATSYLIDNLPGWLGSLTEWLVGTALPEIIIHGTEMALKLAEWVTESAAYLITNLPGWLASLTGWLASDALPAITGWGLDAAIALGKAFLGALDWMDDIAQEIVEGLISGLWKMAGRLAGAVSDFISENITGKIKSALSINSPSRVTMELGVGVAEGLALGMRRSQGMVANAAGGLALAAVPQAQAGGGFTAPSYGAVEVPSAGRWNAAPIVVETYLDGRQIATSLAPHQRQIERSKR